jgi:hypothetical protein
MPSVDQYLYTIFRDFLYVVRLNGIPNRE